MNMNHGLRRGTIGIPTLSIRVEKKNCPTLNYSSYLTGGDDLKLKVWDTRCGFESPILVNRRSGQRILKRTPFMALSALQLVSLQCNAILISNI